MEWQTEKLICRCAQEKFAEYIPCVAEFEIPADDVQGKNAKKNLLHAAEKYLATPECDLRLVRHNVDHTVISAKVAPIEFFTFKHRQTPTKYIFSLKEINTTPIFANDGDSKIFLAELKKNRSDALQLKSCRAPKRIIRAAGDAVELHYLTLKSCYHVDNAPIFPEIGRLKNLRGLDLDQLHDKVRGCIVFDSNAAAEFSKLENLEVLALRNGIIYTDEALAALGKFKKLKALHLFLLNHPFIDKRACLETLSFLPELNDLEYLRIETRFAMTSQRLDSRDLSLPPNLKYLKLDGICCRIKKQ